MSIYIYIYINDPNQEAHQLTARGNIVSNLCVYVSAFDSPHVVLQYLKSIEIDHTWDPPGSVGLAVAIKHYLLGACEVSRLGVKSAKKDYNHYFGATAQIKQPGFMNPSNRLCP